MKILIHSMNANECILYVHTHTHSNSTYDEKNKNKNEKIIIITNHAIYL
jgi:hypothetical protein